MLDGMMFAQPLVLVAEAFRDARQMYVEYLRYCGFRVEEAADGHEVVEKCTQLMPDVVLMDLTLSRLDGFEATARLKRDPVTATIPIIAITSHSFPEFEERAKQVGCIGFLRKPCLPDELYNAIQEAVRV